MRYKYNFYLNKAKDINFSLRKKLDAYDVIYKDEGILITFSIFEDNMNWNTIYPILKNHDCGEIIECVYSKDEIENAPMLRIVPKKIKGYPLPDDYDHDNKNYLDYTYDRTLYCPDCGVEKKQVNSFMISKKAVTLNNWFCFLNWIGDEIFTSHKTGEKIVDKGINGIELLKVFQIESNSVFDDFIQLRINTIINAELLFTAVKTLKCKTCQQSVKYVLHRKTQLVYKKADFPVIPDFFKSKEFFGDGAAASRLLFISKKTRQILDELHIKNIEYEPVGLM